MKHIKKKMEQILQKTRLIAVSGVYCSSMMHVFECVVCYISLLSVYMCVRSMPLSARSVAGVSSAGRFRASLLLHITCVRS